MKAFIRYLNILEFAVLAAGSILCAVGTSFIIFCMMVVSKDWALTIDLACANMLIWIGGVTLFKSSWAAMQELINQSPTKSTSC